MARQKQSHTSAPPGKRCRIVLKDGTVFIDKFRMTEKGWTTFDDHKVRTADLKSLTIYRQIREDVKQ